MREGRVFSRDGFGQRTSRWARSQPGEVAVCAIAEVMCVGSPDFGHCRGASGRIPLAIRLCGRGTRERQT
ncbi:hypothetical protein chiPu_0029899 [Chiloscyllium punctatum]|uniref:Uncharacterized protein n=1 Tax=Chiloscyllium punctatum TaxID=137246 RepID=A0A401TSK1_CHIPU|nr:hypothetical protein [Chiloscyllium punctatum]